MVGKREEAEAAALVHETLLGDGWQNATIGAAITDDDDRYVACNDAFCRLTGYSRSEIVEPTASLELTPDQTFGTGHIRRKDGTVVPVNYWRVPTKVAQADFYLVLLWVPGEGPELDGSNRR